MTRLRRIVMHLDMDAFFASVEQRDHPEHRGRPVVVGADPMDGRGRGVVAAASYEARRFGIRSALPISTAWRRCPDAVFLRPRFDRYAEVSRGVFHVIRESVDVFEPASIDEAYADVTARAHGSFEEAEALARALKRRVRHEFDLTVSVGVGPNKLVAKIASDLDKPDGLKVVRPQAVAAVLGPLPASRIPGVGPKTAEVLDDLGVGTIADLAERDPDEMRGHFGVWGPEMVRLAQGADERPVDPAWDRKSVGAEETYLHDLPPDELDEALGPVVEEAVGRLRRDGAQGRTITLKVRLASFETFTRARTLAAPTDDAAVVAKVARDLLREAAVEEPVRLLGVRISGFEAGGPRQLNLDAWPADVLGAAGAWRPTRRTWRF